MLNKLNIIPKPIKAERGEGSAFFNASIKFCGEFSNEHDFWKTLLPKGDADNTITFCRIDSADSESYEIAVKEGDIKITASNEIGALWAIQTLLQLEKDGKVPEVTVSDKPRFSHRCFMLDCSRHFWTVEQIKHILDFMASIKLNRFHWHLTDDQGWRIEIKKYPLLCEVGAVRQGTSLWREIPNESENTAIDPRVYGRGMFYTQDDAREIVAYAKALGIEVIPEIDMPGHFTAAIAAYPFLSCSEEQIEVGNYWGILYNILCAGKEEVYDFVGDILDEVCEIFPYEYFHIGGDEVPKRAWEACDKCRQKMAEEGLRTFEELQGYFNRRLVAMLASHGKKAVGWNEVLDTGSVKPEILPQWWTLESKKGKELEYVADGGKIILSPTSCFYLDFPHAKISLEQIYSFDPTDMGIVDDSCVLGIEAPLWCEYIRSERKLSLNAYARLLALSEISWGTTPRDYADFEKRVEALREKHSEKGFELAPQFVYRGETVPEQLRSDLEKVHKLWYNHPNFELDAIE